MNRNEIHNLIRELIEKTTVAVEQITFEENGFGSENTNSKTNWFSVEVSDPRLFCDRGGEGLSALNHLIRRILEGKSEKPEEINILVDINGFQKKRIENIHAIAHMMAERARYFKSNIEVEPMSAFERRIVHEFLADAPDLKTESEGEGSARRVVIKYTGSI